MANMIETRLGVSYYPILDMMFKSYESSWRHDYDTIHTLVLHRYYADQDSPIKEFNEKNVLNYNFTYGQMCREVLFKIRKLTPFKFNPNVIESKSFEKNMKKIF
jgi:hypothetical protein